MDWRKQVKSNNELIVHPWSGGREVIDKGRWFFIDGILPHAHGWHRFELIGKRALWKSSAEPPKNVLTVEAIRGFYFHGKLIKDDADVGLCEFDIYAQAEPVYLLPISVDDGTRISCFRHEDKRLIYIDKAPDMHNQGRIAMNIVLRWFKSGEWIKTLDKKTNRRNLEVQLDALMHTYGANFVQQETGGMPFEIVVRYMVRGRMLECVLHRESLEVIDAGISVHDHFEIEYPFTLDSLLEIVNIGVSTDNLIVYRHVEETEQQDNAD